MEDPRIYVRNLNYCQKKAWKIIQAWTGFEPNERFKCENFNFV